MSNTGYNVRKFQCHFNPPDYNTNSASIIVPLPMLLMRAGHSMSWDVLRKPRALYQVRGVPASPPQRCGG